MCKSRFYHILFTTIECDGTNYSHYICYFSNHRAYPWYVSSNFCDVFCYHVWYNPGSPSVQSLPTCYFSGHKSYTFLQDCLQDTVSQFYLNTYTPYVALYVEKNINKYVGGISCSLFFAICVFEKSIHFLYLAYLFAHTIICLDKYSQHAIFIYGGNFSFSHAPVTPHRFIVLVFDIGGTALAGLVPRKLAFNHSLYSKCTSSKWSFGLCSVFIFIFTSSY